MEPPDPPPEPAPHRPAITRRPQGRFQPATPRRAPGGTPFPSGPFAPLAFTLMLTGATAAVFLAGKPQQGAMGVFLLFAGVAMIACPPRIAVNWRLWLAAAALTGCASLALLPERLLPQPAWRHTLESTPPIVLPGTISTMPGLTAFWLAVLALSLLSGLFLLAQPLRSRWLLTFALTAAVVAGIYAGMAIYAKETGWHYPFAADATFGFFPNRNHTATFLVVGSLLALGVLGVVLREERWLLAALAAGVIATCGSGLAFFSPSRGGIVFLLVGVGLWIAGLGREHRDRRLVVSFVAVLLALGVLFMVSGGEARNRMLGRKTPTPASTIALGTGESEDALHNLSADFRLKIWRDTAAAIRDFPLTGMGLGTFSLVFPQYRQASLSDTSVLHPESDWFMLMVEAGIPAALCLLTLAWLAAGQLRSAREHAYWPLRWGVAVAVGAAALHGVVDVPWHRVQLGWWLLVVAGLALQNARPETLKPSRLQHAGFVVGGLAALTLGAMLARAQWFGGPPLPPFAAGKAQADILAAFDPKNMDPATDLAHQTIKDWPMVASTYYQLGVLLMPFTETGDDVDRAFSAQRQLNPSWTFIPLQQGDAWQAVDPDRAAALWLEAWERQRRINNATGAPPEADLVFYRRLFERADHFPAVRRPLGRIATQSPRYALAWLAGTEAEVNADDWNRLTGLPEFLHAFSENERQRFLLLWYANAGVEPVDRFVGGHPDWQGAAWPVHLRELVDTHQFEALVREAAAHYEVSLDLHLPDAPADGDAAVDPANEDPLNAFARYRRADNDVTARRVLEEADADAQKAGQKPLPPAYWQTRMAVAVQDQAWPVAWGHLKRYLQQTHPNELLP